MYGGQITRHVYLNGLIFSAKRGDRQAMREMRAIFSDLADGVFARATIFHPPLKAMKFCVYYDYVLAFWKTVHEHRIGQDELFARSLSLNLAECARRVAVNRLGIKDPAPATELALGGARTPVKAERHKAIQAIKRIPPRQKQAVSLYFYEGLSVEKSAVRIGASTDRFHICLSRACRTINRSLKKVKKGSKCEKYGEKVYKVVESRID